MKTLPEEDQERYSQLKKEALLYETQVENASSELMVMENRSKQLEADLSQFPVSLNFIDHNLNGQDSGPKPAPEQDILVLPNTVFFRS